jgi:hypothetical protein
VTRSSLARLAILVTVCAACRAAPSEPQHNALEERRSALEEQRADELLILSVQPDEVAMADRLVPVSLREPTCVVPIIQGIGRFADVGWVSPRFFLVRATDDDPGYRFLPLGDERERFIARFRAPRSEHEAHVLNGPDEIPPDAEGLFCNVSATLAQVAERTTVRRLAIWPVDGIRASMQIRGSRRMMAVQREADWATAREVTVSLDLSAEEARILRRDLRSVIGSQVDFFVSNRWRRAACTQTVDLTGVPGIDAYGLRDGESGAIALSTIKAAVRRLVSRDTRVVIEGECGGAMLGTEPRAGDETQTLSCKRIGESLDCLYEGEYSDHPTTIRTHANIGQPERAIF